MIALGMLYAVVASSLLAATAWLLELVARPRRWPTRVIWAAAMAVMVLGTVSAVGLQVGRARAAVTTVRHAEALSAAPGARHSTAVARQVRGINGGPLHVIEARILARLGALGAHVDAWNRALLGGWALVTAFLAGVLAHAALEGRRLQHGLEERTVLGTRVRLTDAVGPSAVGTLSPGILLPQWAAELDEPLLTLVLQHEREHLAARDPLLLLGALVAVVLVPWNLPIWWAWQRLRLAMEVDCDARVLRAQPDVRRYAQLLLLTAQHVVRTPWASRPVMSVAAPLQPHTSHLASRIRTMTHARTSRTILRSALALGAAAATATVALALPVPVPATDAPSHPSRAVVHITSVGMEGIEGAGDSLAYPILIYATGQARVGIAGKPPVPLTDTLRLYRLPALTADVTDADVHLELTGPGSISVGGDVTGGPATHLTATGHHIVLLKGGIGVRRMS